MHEMLKKHEKGLEKGGGQFFNFYWQA